MALGHHLAVILNHLQEPLRMGDSKAVRGWRIGRGG